MGNLLQYFAGLLSTLYGALILVADLWFPLAIANFFGLDVVKDGEMFYHEVEEEEEVESALNLSCKLSCERNKQASSSVVLLVKTLIRAYSCFSGR